MKTAETSLQAYINNKKQLETLKEKVIFSLKRYCRIKDKKPTYNELKQYMMDTMPGISYRASIQPRLTHDLVEEGKVERAGKRKCRVSGEEISTWKPSQGDQ